MVGVDEVHINAYAVSLGKSVEGMVITCDRSSPSAASR